MRNQKIATSSVLIAAMIGLGSPATVWAQPEPGELCCGCTDCNGNGVDDACDVSCSNSGIFCLGGQPANDLCNSGNFPSCGTACDVNDNDVPDECEPPFNILFVDDDAAPGGDGRTWCSAFQFLQDALALAVTGDEIWVAKGTYYPDDGVVNDDRFATFDIGGGNGPILYGGFAGNEPTLGQRILPTCDDGDDDDDIDYNGKPCTQHKDCGTDENDNPTGTCDFLENATILSGDIDHNDDMHCNDCVGDLCVGGVCIKGNNSYHVVSCHHLSGANPRLDGFIIEGGRADGNGPNANPPALDNQGAAIQIRASTRRCFFEGDPLDDDDDDWDETTCDVDIECSLLTIPDPPGAPYDWHCEFVPCFSGGLDVYNCMIRHNFASNHAAVNDHFENSTYDNCYFHHNQAAKGAALLVDNGSPTINNCLFQDNETIAAPNEGAAVWAQGRDIPGLCPANPAPSISNCDFNRNSAFVDGGGLWVRFSNPLVDTCNFVENSAINEGGAIYTLESNITINRCKFLSNRATHAGGGVWMQSQESPITELTVRILDSDFVGNATLFPGGSADAAALYVANLSNFEVNRCRFIGNFINGDTTAGVLDADSECSRYINCLFLANQQIGAGAAGTNVGAFEVISGNVELINCTMVGNAVVGNAGTGGLFVTDLDNVCGSLTVTNSILFGNAKGTVCSEAAAQLVLEGNCPVEGENNSLTVTYTLVQDDVADCAYGVCCDNMCCGQFMQCCSGVCQGSCGGGGKGGSQ